METNYPALQHPRELSRFLDLISREGVRRYLEIGSKYGGTLWQIASRMPQGSLVVAVDLPVARTEPTLRECVRELISLKVDAHLLLGDSTDPSIIAEVRKFGPFDLVFIDANHTEKYVWDDWRHYGPLARLVAFHDIGWTQPNRPGRLPIEVPKVWDQIKTSYHYEEIKEDAGHNGIGVLWRNG